MPLAANVDLTAIAANTADFSGAELAALCREAALAALEEDIGALEVSRARFTQAMGVVRPRTTTETLNFFSSYAKALLDRNPRQLSSKNNRKPSID